MRRAVALIVTAAVLAACGSGAGAGADDARRTVRRAQLVAGDLGPDWRRTAEEPPAGGPSDGELERCVGSDLHVADRTVAESATRTFERAAGAEGRQQVVASSAVLEDADDARRLVRVVGSPRFARCLAGGFAAQLEATSPGATVQPGRPVVDRSPIDDADRSALVSAPFALRAPPLDTAGRADVLVVSSGRTVSVVLAFGVGTPVSRGVLGRLGDLLARRQRR